MTPAVAPALASALLPQAGPSVQELETTLRTLRHYLSVSPQANHGHVSAEWSLFATDEVNTRTGLQSELLTVEVKKAVVELASAVFEDDNRSSEDSYDTIDGQRVYPGSAAGAAGTAAGAAGSAAGAAGTAGTAAGQATHHHRKLFGGLGLKLPNFLGGGKGKKGSGVGADGAPLSPNLPPETPSPKGHAHSPSQNHGHEHGHGHGHGHGHDHRNTQFPGPPLPEGWEWRWAEEKQKFYYKNLMTGVKTWHHPDGDRATQEANAVSSTGATGAAPAQTSRDHRYSIGGSGKEREKDHSHSHNRRASTGGKIAAHDEHYYYDDRYGHGSPTAAHHGAKDIMRRASYQEHGSGSAKQHRASSTPRGSEHYREPDYEPEHDRGYGHGHGGVSSKEKDSRRASRHTASPHEADVYHHHDSHHSGKEPGRRHSTRDPAPAAHAPSRRSSSRHYAEHSSDEDSRGGRERGGRQHRSHSHHAR